MQNRFFNHQFEVVCTVSASGLHVIVIDLEVTYNNMGAPSPSCPQTHSMILLCLLRKIVVIGLSAISIPSSLVVISDHEFHHFYVIMCAW